MIRILACGKVRDSWLRSGIEEYARRIRPYEKLEIEEVADEKAPESNSDAENRQVIAAEGERLLKKIRPQDYVI
ncbi:MAG: 23S rRNA (pseudouridine(1915)-N(3))-methyltransferase RlmH, partial [Solobacterium sp.]|nr:23S rRNA (pseudouridine(1915)-N(3))-methyltransferase RlmH [Solobacterium sp.]